MSARPLTDRATTLVTLAGLPGTGKSALARELARELGAPLLDKDRVREALFGHAHVAYSREQDDFVVGLLFRTVEHLLATSRPAHVVLDGRTFSRREQVDALRGFAHERALELRLIECTCSPEVARSRLELDAARGEHPAANRGLGLYRALAASADPIAEPKLVVATDALRRSELSAACLAYVRAPSASA